MILLIDNYDSFVHNLARYFRVLGQETYVVRNDEVSFAQLDQSRPDAIVLSPGPCAPQQAGCSIELVQRWHQHIPMLGVCLGHQTIAEALGGKIVRAREPVHGQASWIEHDGTAEFTGLPSPLRVGRYHSLVVHPDSLPAELSVTARLNDASIMAIRHVHLPIFGWQFHPESVLTTKGFQLIANFLREAGLAPHAIPDLQEHWDLHCTSDWFSEPIETNPQTNAICRKPRAHNT